MPKENKHKYNREHWSNFCWCQTCTVRDSRLQHVYQRTAVVRSFFFLCINVFFSTLLRHLCPSAFVSLSTFKIRNLKQALFWFKHSAVQVFLNVNVGVLSNYQPILKLSFFVKVLEKGVLNQLLSFLYENNI